MSMKNFPIHVSFISLCLMGLSSSVFAGLEAAVEGAGPEEQTAAGITALDSNLLEVAFENLPLSVFNSTARTCNAFADAARNETLNREMRERATIDRILNDRFINNPETTYTTGNRRRVTVPSHEIQEGQMTREQYFSLTGHVSKAGGATPAEYLEGDNRLLPVDLPGMELRGLIQRLNERARELGIGYTYRLPSLEEHKLAYRMQHGVDAPYEADWGGIYTNRGTPYKPTEWYDLGPNGSYSPNCGGAWYGVRLVRTHHLN